MKMGGTWGSCPSRFRPTSTIETGSAWAARSLFPPPGTFEAIGGRAAIARLVDGLYDRIENDTLLRPAFNRDLTKEREKLKLFFEAWFGGAPTYFNAEWPPSLKAVHVPVSISQGMAMRWLGHFLDSFADAVQDPAIINPIKPFITRLALALVDRVDEPVPGERIRDVSDPVFMQSVQRDDAADIAKDAAVYPNVLLHARAEAFACRGYSRQGQGCRGAPAPGGECKCGCVTARERCEDLWPAHAAHDPALWRACHPPRPRR